MNLVHIERDTLPRYIKQQINHLLPFQEDASWHLIDQHLDQALQRLHRCIAQVRMWQPNQFDVLHSSQYCIFLYYLANTIWQKNGSSKVCTALFLLNKCMNGIDCFYEIELPEVFFIGHSVGIVLAKATYGEHLVLYQNVTVGKNHGVAPVLEHGVILYPNSAVIGRCHIGSQSVIGQGVGVVNHDTPANHLVFQGAHNHLVFKPNGKPILADFFRDKGPTH
jgi:serine O-acetyltransferase